MLHLVFSASCPFFSTDIHNLYVNNYSIAVCCSNLSSNAAALIYWYRSVSSTASFSSTTKPTFVLCSNLIRPSLPLPHSIGFRLPALSFLLRNTSEITYCSKSWYKFVPSLPFLSSRCSVMMCTLVTSFVAPLAISSIRPSVHINRFSFQSFHPSRFSVKAPRPSYVHTSQSSWSIRHAPSARAQSQRLSTVAAIAVALFPPNYSSAQAATLTLPVPHAVRPSSHSSVLKSQASIISIKPISFSRSRSIYVCRSSALTILTPPFWKTNSSNVVPAFTASLLPTRADPLVQTVLKSAFIVALVALVVTLAVISIMFAFQDAIVYKPTRVWRGNPASSGMPHYDDVRYTTRDGVQITGWFIRQPEDQFKSARTLIYFHGRDKNASFRLGKVIGLYDQCRCNILLISYRGFGRSTGKPNERGMRIDADGAYHYLASRGDVDVGPGGNLWVYGESLGGAVAVYFSKLYQDRINALILENTFTSLLDMAKVEFPMLGVLRYLSLNRWQSKKRIGDLRIPLLFLSGLKDAYIPPKMMRQMHALAVSSPLKEFVEFENGTHNRTWNSPGFFESIAAFMDRVEDQVLHGDKHAETPSSINIDASQPSSHSTFSLGV